MLKTDYKNDVLDTSKNTKRKYQQTSNSDGTISLDDVTVYSQEGSLLGANDINATNQAVNNINVYVGEDKKLHFVNGEGADSVLPFKSGVEGIVSEHFYVSGTNMYTGNMAMRIPYYGVDYMLILVSLATSIGRAFSIPSGARLVSAESVNIGGISKHLLVIDNIESAFSIEFGVNGTGDNYFDVYFGSNNMTTRTQTFSGSNTYNVNVKKPENGNKDMIIYFTNAASVNDAKNGGISIPSNAVLEYVREYRIGATSKYELYISNITDDFIVNINRINGTATNTFFEIY